MTHRIAVILVLLTVVIWGTTFPLIKQVTGVLEPAVLIGVRFSISALILLPFVRGINKEVLKHGVILGVLLFFSFLAQIVGLQTTTSNKSAFITGLNVVLVPLLGPLFRKPAPRTALFAALLAIVGIYLMAGELGQFVVGDAWTFLCAISFALYILVLERYAPKHPVLPLTSIQSLTVAMLAVFWSLKGISAPTVLLEPAKDHWLTLLYLAIIATAVTTLLQTAAQRLLRGFEAALIYALEPVFAAVFAFVILGERLGLQGLIGGAIIVGATVWSQYKVSYLDA